MPHREPGAPADERLASLVGSSRRLASEPDLGSALRYLLESAIRLTGAERGFFLFRRSTREGARCEAAVPSLAAVPGSVPAQLSRSVLALALDSGEGVLSTNIAADERFRARVSMRRLGVRSVLAVPFLCRGGGTGVIYLDSLAAQTLFRHEDLEVLEAFVAQAALAHAHRLLASGSVGAGGGIAAPPILRSPSPVPLPGGRATLQGNAPAVRRVRELIERIGPTELPVLVIGESGTGKELVARAIHEASARRERPFLAENCAAIPETLLESELFGSMRGAFTGAERDRDGLFRAADGGTLFLDEIGEMPLAFQARLLRALQESEVRPVGSPRPVRVNVRVLAAMNRVPSEAIASGRLRLDLYYRLAGMTIELPPLRARREDIPLLAARFLARAAVSGAPPARLSSEALQSLSSYDWPGNVRELENEIERAAVLSSGGEITLADLSTRLVREVASPPQAPPSAERAMIEAALAGAHGRITAAAAVIGWTRQKLYRRMEHLGIPRSYARRQES
jgi:transcriptional regulator with GAF, ATPase, and Fis domain